MTGTGRRAEVWIAAWESGVDDRQVAAVRYLTSPW
mgnify:CR=1 FL=1